MIGPRQTFHPLRELPLRFRLLLALLPGHVRDEHARELRDELTEHVPSTFTLALDVLRAAPGAHWDVLRQDVRLALRQLRRAPAFSVIAGMTLAIGIGGNVAFFTLVDGVLLRQLPIAGAERIVDITEENLGRNMRAFGVAPANFRDLTRDTTRFQAAAVYTSRAGAVRVGETSERVQYAAVSGNFFRVFTDAPLLGRTLAAEDDVPGTPRIVLSYGFWQRALGGDARAVGRTIEVDGKPFAIVGVMPDRFAFPTATTDFWAPIALSASEWDRRGARFVAAAARLRPGVSVARAAAGTAAIAQSLATQYPRTNAGWTVLVRELRDARTARVRTPLLFVWAAGALVLLIAIANVGSLFLTRAVAREREVALRAALGARTGRVVRQLVTEGLVLTALGAAAGLWIASRVLATIAPIAADFVPRLHEVGIGGRSVAYAVLLAALTTALLASIATSPLRGLRIWDALGATRTGTSRGRRRLQRTIVTAEVALAVFVLVAGTLVTRTLVGLLSQPLGFDPSDVLTFRIEPPWRVNLAAPADSLFPALALERRRADAAYRSMLDGLQALPHVSAAGAISRLPLTGDWWTTSVRIPDQPTGDDGNRVSSYVRVVTAGYLDAMGTHVTRGRALARTDGEGAERVMLVDGEFARRVWGDLDPVGREVLFDGPPNSAPPRARIVGVVETIHMNQLDAELRPTIYVPFAQAVEGHYLDWGMDVVVRGATPRMAGEIRAIVAATFPDAVVFRVAQMADVVSRSTADRRFQLLVVGFFAGLALLLTTVGVGGALLLSVRERRRELAVQMALGARPDRLWWAVQRDAFWLVGGGAVVGVALAIAGARVFSSLVYGVSVRDPVSLLVGPVLVLIASFLAAAIPATRAVRVSPVAVLRE